MPHLTFHKYQGTGNDFVMVDDRQNAFDLANLDLISRLCDRKFGIGADGLILIRDHPEHHFEMIYFNPDGSQSLCGNGSRCAVAFAQALGIIEKECTFLAIDGAHSAVIKNGTIHVKMRDVDRFTALNGDYFINTGSPHYIKMVADLKSADVLGEGRSIRYSQPYQPHGTNVNFVELRNETALVRTYERGVENETLSCGTGVTAVALVLSSRGFSSPVTVQTAGGKLQVSFRQQQDQSFTEVFLIGPALKVFEGVFEY